MTPIEAKVAIIEDDQDWIDTYLFLLKESSHSVIQIITDKQTALEKIPHLQDEGVNIVTLDGNLTTHDQSGNDGKLLRDLIRKHAPKVKIIGLSADKIVGVDVDLEKQGFEILDETITNL